MKRPQSAIVRIHSAKAIKQEMTPIENNFFFDQTPTLKIRPRSKRYAVKSSVQVKAAEKLEEEVNQGRMLINALTDENRKLKTHAEKLRREVIRYENVDESLLNSSKLLGQKPEGSLVPTLKYKIRVQQGEIDNLREQLAIQQRSTKLLRFSEMECQLKQYHEEAERLREMLHEALELNELDIQSQNRLFAALNKLTLMRKEQENLMDINKTYEKQNENLTNEVKKLRLQMNLEISEKGILKRKAYEQQQELLLKIQEIQNKEPDNEKNSLQTMLDDLNYKLQQKERELKEKDEVIVQVKREGQIKLNNYLNELQKIQTIINQKEQQINELHDELGRVTGQVSTQRELQKKVTGKLRSDASTQVPFYVGRVSKDELLGLISKIRFTLKRKKINQKDIPSILAQGGEYSFQSVRQALEQEPFRLNIKESFQMAQYLLSSEESAMKESYNLEKIPLGVFQSRCTHMVPKYDVLSLQEEATLHLEITKKIMRYHQQIDEMVVQLKRQDKCDLPVNYCTGVHLADTFRMIFDHPFTLKQMDYIMQASYEDNGNSLAYYLPSVFKIFHQNTIKKLDNGWTRLSQSESIKILNYFKAPQPTYAVSSNVRRSSMLRDPPSLAQSLATQLPYQLPSGTQIVTATPTPVPKRKMLDFNQAFVVFSFHNSKKKPNLKAVKYHAYSLQPVEKPQKILSLNTLEQISFFMQPQKKQQSKVEFEQQSPRKMKIFEDVSIVKHRDSAGLAIHSEISDQRFYETVQEKEYASNIELFQSVEVMKQSEDSASDEYEIIAKEALERFFELAIQAQQDEMYSPKHKTQPTVNDFHLFSPSALAIETLNEYYEKAVQATK